MEEDRRQAPTHVVAMRKEKKEVVSVDYARCDLYALLTDWLAVAAALCNTLRKRATTSPGHYIYNPGNSNTKTQYAATQNAVPDANFT